MSLCNSKAITKYPTSHQKIRLKSQAHHPNANLQNNKGYGHTERETVQKDLLYVKYVRTDMRVPKRPVTV